MADSRPVVPNYDFSSPFMRVTLIVNPRQGNEIRYPLWVQGDATAVTAPAISVRLNGTTGAGDAENLTLDTLSFVSDVTVDLAVGGIPTIAVTLNPPFDVGRKFINSDLIEWGTSALEVQFGYATGPDGPVISPPYVGIIQTPDVSFGSDISISLKALGQAGYFLVSTGEAGVLLRRSRLEHINALASSLDVPRGEDLLNEDSTKLLSFEETIITSTQSSLAIIYEIARKCGCWLELSENKLRLISMAKMVLAAPVAILSYFDFPDGKLGPGSASPGFYPILSASSEGDQVYLGHFAKKGFQTALDKSTKTAQTSEQNPEDTSAQSKGDVLPDNKSTKRSKRVEQPKTKTDAAAGNNQKEAEAAQEYNTATTGSGLQLTVETLGFPDIIPGMNVAISGLGSRIDAPYSVYAVKHSLSSSGFTTSLTLMQNSGKLSEALQQAFPGTVFGQSNPVTPVASPASQLDTPKGVYVTPNVQSPPDPYSWTSLISTTA